MPTACRGALPAAVLLCAAALLPAQQKPAANAPSNSGAELQSAQGVIRSTTRLVTLDVVVTDKQGNVVRGLKREDFHVTEAKTPQTVSFFEEAGANIPKPQTVINSTADLDRQAPDAPVNIVLLDEFNTRFEDMAFARYSLKKFLDTQPARLTIPTELVAVSLDHFTVLHDYTQDKQALLDALKHHFAAYPWQVHNGGWLAERYAMAFSALRSVALATEGHPGHKNMIWIGRGFPTIDTSQLDPQSRDAIQNAVDNVVNTLRDARVTLYTIDPAGLMTDPGKYGGGMMIDAGDSIATTPDPFGGNYQFTALATATGGQSLYGRNDVDAQIGTAIRDGSSFYTLAYYPTGNSEDSAKFRAIKVTVDRPGLTAITREGYYLQNKQQPLSASAANKVAEQQLLGDLIAADRTRMVYDGVQLAVIPVPEQAAFRITIDSNSVKWIPDEQGRPYADFIVMISTFDAKGKELERSGRDLRVTSSAQKVGNGAGINVLYVFHPDPRAVRAHFVVRISDSGRIGSQDMELTPQNSVPRKLQGTSAQKK